MSFRAVLFDWRGTLATTPTASEWLAVYEHGRQKPDPLLFAVTLDTLGVAPADALMAGDRAGPDGGAVDAGLTTLLLPPLRGPPRPEAVPRPGAVRDHPTGWTERFVRVRLTGFISHTR